MAAFSVYVYYGIDDSILYFLSSSNIQNGDIALWKKGKLEGNDTVDIYKVITKF